MNVEENRFQFDKTDENQRFKFEEMKLNCEVLRSHVEKCLERLNEIKSSNNDRQEKKNFEEICSMRQRCNELVEQNNKIKAELTEARKRIQQQEKVFLFAKNRRRNFFFNLFSEPKFRNSL